MKVNRILGYFTNAITGAGVFLFLLWVEFFAWLRKPTDTIPVWSFYLVQLVMVVSVCVIYAYLRHRYDIGRLSTSVLVRYVEHLGKSIRCPNWYANSCTPAIWKGRAPILFPVAGGFKDDGYELDGQWYGMPKHGFAKTEEWAVESADEEEATFLLTAQKPGFPFRYEFRAVFSLEANQLEVNYVVKNLDDRTFYFSVGAHEAYACPGKIEDYYLVFDEKDIPI